MCKVEHYKTVSKYNFLANSVLCTLLDKRKSHDCFSELISKDAISDLSTKANKYGVF